MLNNESSLDVYKRQVSCVLFIEPGNNIQRPIWCVHTSVHLDWFQSSRGDDGYVPVSYTHLDVYKRQGYNLRLILHCIADCRNHILLFLGILRADKDTPLTVNTLTFYDPGLMIMNTYRLDRAVPNTFVTIFTTDFFKLKD